MWPSQQIDEMHEIGRYMNWGENASRVTDSEFSSHVTQTRTKLKMSTDTHNGAQNDGTLHTIVNVVVIIGQL